MAATEEQAVAAPLVERFKLSMRLIASTVAVVTAVRRGARSGLTATALCSLSMEPPSLLVCINRSSSTHDYIIDSGQFRVNLLASHQQHVAEIFSGMHGHEREDRFGTAEPWGDTPNDAPPALSGALASILCSVRDRVETGTHSIFVGCVEDAKANPSQLPLIYANRKFSTINS
jgi:flavin reductase (DIM6/NTAB) family NADH-FMN oxidoreductase RutF